MKLLKSFKPFLGGIYFAVLLQTIGGQQFFELQSTDGSFDGQYEERPLNATSQNDNCMRCLVNNERFRYPSYGEMRGGSNPIKVFCTYKDNSNSACCDVMWVSEELGFQFFGDSATNDICISGYCSNENMLLVPDIDDPVTGLTKDNIHQMYQMCVAIELLLENKRRDFDRITDMKEAMEANEFEPEEREAQKYLNYEFSYFNGMGDPTDICGNDNQIDFKRLSKNQLWLNYTGDETSIREEDDLPFDEADVFSCALNFQICLGYQCKLKDGAVYEIRIHQQYQNQNQYYIVHKNFVKGNLTGWNIIHIPHNTDNDTFQLRHEFQHDIVNQWLLVIMDIETPSGKMQDHLLWGDSAVLDDDGSDYIQAMVTFYVILFIIIGVCSGIIVVSYSSHKIYNKYFKDNQTEDEPVPQDEEAAEDGAESEEEEQEEEDIQTPFKSKRQ